MIYHAIKIKHITQHHLMWFEIVKEMIINLPDGLDCHQVCVEIAEKYWLVFEAIRGHFNNFDHSWLRYRQYPANVILDPYPWGGGAPLLIVDCLPWHGIYVEINNQQICPQLSDFTI